MCEKRNLEVGGIGILYNGALDLRNYARFGVVPRAIFLRKCTRNGQLAMNASDANLSWNDGRHRPKQDRGWKLLCLKLSTVLAV